VGIQYYPSWEGETVDPTTANILQTVANTVITEQFAKTTHTATVDITQPSGAITVSQGSAVTLTASATDSASGNLSSSITWRSNISGVLGTGPSISISTLAPGYHAITAKVTGSDGHESLDYVEVTITTSGNNPPTANDDYRNVSYNSPWTQTYVVGNDTDDTGLDYSSLTVVNQPAHGTITAVHTSGVDVGTIDVSYAGTNYIGPDSFTYKIMDINGVWSNVATVYLTVSGP
jgi:hypothetical protein